MNTFNDYVASWFHSFLKKHEDEEEFNLTLLNALLELEDNETIDDYLDSDSTPLDYLLSMEAVEIYPKFFGYDRIQGLKKMFPDIPDTEKFLRKAFLNALEDLQYKDFSFSRELVGDMASSASDYSDPSHFFQDLQQGGCQSGMVGMFIYNDDCLAFYGRHANDLEEFKESLEEELGMEIHNSNGVYHYVWICWLCYEELGHQIAQYLWPDAF